MTTPYYPAVKAQIHKGHTILSTSIRKQHTDGVWYDFYVSISYPSNGYVVEDQLQNFHAECYRAVMLGVIVPELKDSNGVELYKKSLVEMDEIQRLQLRNLPQKLTKEII